MSYLLGFKSIQKEGGKLVFTRANGANIALSLKNKKNIDSLIERQAESEIKKYNDKTTNALIVRAAATTYCMLTCTNEPKIIVVHLIFTALFTVVDDGSEIVKK